MKLNSFFNNRSALVALMLSGALSGAAANVDDPNSSLPDSLRWNRGPTTVELPGSTSLPIPAGCRFLDGGQTKLLLAALHNKTSGNEVGFIASESGGWSLVIEFHEVGFVSDDGWEKLDPTAILEAIRTTDQRANAEREAKGWATIHVRDWEQTPAYDPAAHSMEWAVRAESQDATVINRVISVLGRRGVLQFILVDPRQTPSALALFKELVRGLKFNPGEAFTDSRPGDKVAVGGLAAVVLGLNAPETEVPVANTAVSDPATQPVANVRLSPNSGWLIGMVAAVAGLLAGKILHRGRRRGRRVSNHAGSLKPGIPSSAGAYPPASKSSARSRSEGAGSAEVAASAEPVFADSSPGEPGKRHRRCNSYGFYMRLTRDLHWTINY